MGEELREDEREIFSQLTGREREPGQRVDQFAAVIGRRGGKSRAMATLATYIAGLCDHSDALVPGERGVLLAWRSISGWQRSSSTTRRPASNAVRS
jgi:hypothetical protein